MNSIFFVVSKLVWFVIAPDSLLLILSALALLLFWRGKTRPAKWLSGIAAFCWLIVCLFPVAEWLCHPLETRFPTNPSLPPTLSGVIVLGGGEDADRSAIWGQPEVGDSADRIIAFLILARRYPVAKLVYTGGSGSLFGQEAKGASAAGLLCEQLGLDLHRVTFECNSRNTYENVMLSKTMVQPDPNEQWVMITSAWHMPRAVGIFRKAGWPVIRHGSALQDPGEHSQEPPEKACRV